MINIELKSLTPRSLLHKVKAFSKARPGEEVDQLGVPIRLHYAFISISSFFMSVIPLAISFTPAGEALSAVPIRIACVIGIFLIPGYWFWGKSVSFRRDMRLYHFAAAMGILSVGMCAIYIDELLGPLAASLLTTPMIIGYFQTFRQSFPHILCAAAIIVAVQPHLGEADSVLRTAILLIVMLTGWLVVTTTKNRLVNVLDEHRELSETDQLTGASNVRRLQSLLDREIARSNRAGGGGFSLIEFDLDEFKQTNDRYSHTTGDRVLIAAADAARAELSESDLLVRRGGDEFTIVAPTISDRDVDRLCQSIAEGIARARTRICPDLRATASVGSALHQRDETAQELVERADDSVRNAKHASRDPGIAPGPTSSDSGANKPGRLSLVDDSAAPVSGPEKARVRSTPRDPIVAATSFAWKQAAALFVGVNIVLSALAVSGKTSIDPNPMFFVMSAAGLGLAGVCWWISTREKSPPAMTHLLAIGTLLVITISGIGRGTAATAGAELFLIPILFQFYLLPTRTAIVYALITMSLFAGVLGYGKYPKADLRVNAATNTMLLTGVVLMFSRRRTIEVATENANLARTDALTGLPNTRLLQDRLENEIVRSTTTGAQLSVLMLDLDDFKRVNDVYGHSRGDNVLAGVADAIRDNVRRSEMPARRGGDEFAVILTDAGEAEAAEALRRFGPAIERVRTSLCDDVLPSASIGFATWRPGESCAELLERADAALHDSKVRAHAYRDQASLIAAGSDVLA